MKRALRLLCAIIATLLFLSASSCTNINYNEPEDLQFVAGMAIDRLPDGQMQVTVELENTKGGENPELQAKYLVMKGANVVDAARNSLTLTDKTLYWNHMDLVIVSEEVAQKYLTEVLDTLIRMYNINMSLTVAVSKMPTAKEILMNQGTPEETLLSSDVIVNSLRIQKRLGKAPLIKLFEFYDDAMDEGRSGYLPTVSIYSDLENTLQISGSAVFNGIWLAGYLDDEETKTMLLLLDQQKLLSYALPASPTGAYSNASIDLMPDKVTIKPSYANGKASVDIKIVADVSLMAINGASEDNSHQEALIEDLLRNTAMMLERNAYSLIDKTRTMNSADVLGVGATYKDKHGQEWKQIGSQWRDLYKDMDVTVSAKLRLRNTGLIQAPAKYGD